jgi:hypothetical protein
MCQGQHIEHRHLSFVLVQKWRLAEQLEELATRTANLPSGIWRAMKPQSDDGHALPGMLAPMKRLPSPTYRLLGVNILSILLRIVGVPIEHRNSIGIMQP